MFSCIPHFLQNICFKKGTGKVQICPNLLDWINNTEKALSTVSSVLSSAWLHRSNFALKRKIFIKILKILWRLSTILKTSNKGIWSDVFWYVKVCIFCKCIQYTIHWDKIETLKKNFGQTNSTKNALFFLLRAPTHHSFTFNLWFLYELKHKVRLSKTVWDFPFSIPFCFY